MYDYNVVLYMSIKDSECLCAVGKISLQLFCLLDLHNEWVTVHVSAVVCHFKWI